MPCYKVNTTDYTEKPQLPNTVIDMGDYVEFNIDGYKSEIGAIQSGETWFNPSLDKFFADAIRNPGKLVIGYRLVTHPGDFYTENGWFALFDADKCVITTNLLNRCPSYKDHRCGSKCKVCGQS